ncbi:integrase [Tanacetum coccineum]|uniref:Integrase n=1 Tax=Tanacetum coccineum TaxID=301880 RepID=A0ABQ5BQG3_9ASTR
MIEPFLITNNLMGYVDGSIPCLSKTLSVTDGATISKENPNYPIWVSNDAHVRMLIISTISEASFRNVQGTTSRDLWLSLEKAYAPHSTSREYTLKTQLLRIEMHGDEALDAYLNRAQEYVDALAAIGEPPHALLSDHDYMLGKTRAPAPSITSSFAANYAVGSPSMPEARQAQLSELTAQLSALGFQVSPITPSGPQAFYGARSNNNNNNNNNRSNNNNNRGNRNNSRGNNNRGRGNGRQFDWASTQNTIYGTCNRCGIGHIPSQCPNRDPSTIRTRPSANFANTRAQSSNASANWHSDTGTNSHVTPDLAAMDTSEAYYGDDALHVGNVSHLSPTSQTSFESSNGQPSPVSTTSIPTPPPPTPPPPPPPPPPITRQGLTNLRKNPKQRVPYNPSANHATVLPTTITEPTSFTVANNSPELRQAMKEEYDALMKNRTWSLVPRASNTNVVDGKWVYRLKRDKNGAITRYKARFVAKGFRQQPDIQNAFLHGNLKE